jgi:hypothetical protein
MPFTLSTLALIVLGPLLVWRIYSRVKGAMGRQPSVTGRHWLGVLVCLTALVVTVLELGREPALLAAWAGGALFGIGWGVYGVKRTRMTSSDEGWFFVPYAPLGMAVALLFAARILYLMFDLYAGTGAREPFLASPLTVAAITFVSGYFGTVSAGLLRWRLTTHA